VQEEIVRDGRLLLIKIGPLGPVANNAYIIADSQTNDTLVVDAPEGCEALAPSLAGLNVRQVIVTHRHRDHWAGIDTLLDMIDAPVLCHDADREPWEKYVRGALADGDEVAVGGLTLRIVHTPGHTPGCICIYAGDHLLSGDTLFPGGPGRTRSNEDLQQEIESIVSRLYPLPEGVHVYPGHGSNTTIGESKAEYAVFAAKPHDPALSGDVLWLTS
jgi:glyoxylase-like metal-dependent hydrolase (beta-lactamase superfamily II)